MNLSLTKEELALCIKGLGMAVSEFETHGNPMEDFKTLETKLRGILNPSILPPEILEIINELNAEAIRLGELADQSDRYSPPLDPRRLKAKADGIDKAINIITARYIPD